MAIALNSRRITMIVAIVAAALAGILTIRYLSSVQRAPETSAVVSQRYVLIAGRTIHAHERIGPDMLTKVSRPETAVEPGAFAEPHEALGTVALISIPEGSTLTRSKVGVPAALGVTAKLRNGMRAISIPVDFIKSVSSLTAPGDRVDVLATNVHGHNHVTRTIIRGAVVLAVNTALEATDSSASPGPQSSTGPVSVTLGVTPDQANLLNYADVTTSLRLALRPPKEPIRAFPVQAMDFSDDQSLAAAPVYRAPVVSNVPAPLIAAPAPAVGMPPPSVPAPAPTAPATAPKPSILIIEGDAIVAGQR